MDYWRGKPGPGPRPGPGLVCQSLTKHPSQRLILWKEHIIDSKKGNSLFDTKLIRKKTKQNNKTDKHTHTSTHIHTTGPLMSSQMLRKAQRITEISCDEIWADSVHSSCTPTYFSSLGWIKVWEKILDLTSREAIRMNNKNIKFTRNLIHLVNTASWVMQLLTSALEKYTQKFWFAKFFKCNRIYFNNSCFSF